MKSFCRKFFGIIVLIAGLSIGMNAAEVPGAIKYQAVLRDVNGKPLSGKQNINLRISLRLEDPVSGQIAYSEEHTGINANAFGIVNLEIGRGTVISGTRLQDVAWEEHSVYIQIEVETDGNGFTNMGTSELLTVPYAFMAGNVAGQKLYENLGDNFLPKFNAANRTLVNSGLSQTGRDLKVDAASITFLNSAQGSDGYTFPSSVGKRGQTLVLDNAGNLRWETPEGGGTGGGGLNLDFDAAEDGRLIYWNNSLGELAAAPLTYRYASDKGFSVEGDMDLTENLKVSGLMDAGTFKTNAVGVEINGRVTGNNNLLTNDMGDAQIWIGNTQTPLVPRALSGHVHMDNTGKTSLNIVWKGLRLLPGNTATGAPDTVSLVLSGGGGDSLWIRNGADHLYAYNKGKSLSQTYVGIGTDAPQTMLHVQEGDVLFSASANTDGNTPRFCWYPEKSALRAGALSPMNSTHWDKTRVGEYSVALGLDALAESAHSIAIGKEATVTATHAMALGESASVTATEGLAIGLQSQTTANFAVAIGKEAKAIGENSLVLGNNATATANNAIVLGNGQKVDAAAVGIGRSNTIGPNGSGAVVLGINNQAEGSSAIIIGQDNNVGDGTIAIGKGIEISTGMRSVVVGDISDNHNTITGPIVLGTATMSDVGQGLIAVGRDLEENNIRGGNVTMLGANLINGGAMKEPGYKYITMLGDGYYSVDDRIDGNFGAEPVFMFGSTELLNYTYSFVGFQMDNDGTAHFIGDLDVRGIVNSPSDYRLKTDIRPRKWGASLLDSLTPVSFVYKSDRKQRMQLGFIAQEVQKYFPELVVSDAKGMLRMNYIGLIPVLWQINQQLNHRLTGMEQQTAELQRLLEEKDRKITELESTLKAEIEAIKEKIGM